MSKLRSKLAKSKEQKSKTPTHKKNLRRNFLSAHLSRDLRKKINRRSVKIRKGDKVMIMRGSYRGKIGKVLRVDYKRCRIYVEGCTRKTAKGEEKMIAIHPSKVMIVELNLEDRLRKEKLLENFAK